MGTINAERSKGFYDVVLQTFKDPSVQIIIAAEPTWLSEIPSHFIVQRPVPQLDILPHVDLVICHGGQNTVTESLYFGKPLLVAPVKDDQPLVANYVEASGAGRRIPWKRLTADALREAVDDVLLNDKYALAAYQLQQEIIREGGSARAAEYIEAMI